MQVEAHLLLDMKPADVEMFMEKRVGNFKISKNAPLVIETFN